MPPVVPPLLLMTRPEPASRRFAAGLACPGLRVMISPVLRIADVAHDGDALAAARGLVFTSVHAVPAAGGGRGRPAICVGPATAAAARAAGFDVTVGPGDARGLLPMLTGLGPGWLHPHGQHIARDLPVPGIVVYDQQPQDLTAEARMALTGPGPVILPLFSPRSARILSQQAAQARAPLWLAAISNAAADAWQGPSARCLIAGQPDAIGMQRIVETLMDAEQSIHAWVETGQSAD